MPSFLTCATSSGIRLAPSSREYSLCVWRWTKDMYAIGRWLFPGVVANGSLSCSGLQFVPHGIQRDTASLKEHQEMIEEIGCLGRETAVVLRICRHYNFNRFLAHFLRGLSHSAGEQLRRIRAFGPLGRALRDGPGQPPQHVTAGILCGLPFSPAASLARCPADHRGETCPGPGVAGRSDLF